MKQFNSSQSSDTTPLEQIDGELIQTDTSVSPGTALDAIVDRALQEESAQEQDMGGIDHERLYSDDFIRANENASRLLLLGFLGTALVGTSIFAWFVLSQPNDTPEPPPSPTLSVPPAEVPSFNPDNPPSQPAPQPPSNSDPNNSLSQPPLFPATPTNPDSKVPGTPASEGETLIPEGVVPPPPPQQVPDLPGTTTP